MTSAAIPNDSRKTKTRLVSELRNVRARIGELEKSQELTRAALAESKRKVSQTATLLESAQVILETQDFREAAEIIFGICRKFIGAAEGEISILNEDEVTGELLIADGETCPGNCTLPLLTPGAYQKLYRGEPVRIHNFSESERSEIFPSGRRGFENMLLAPLHLNGETVGVLRLANKPGGFTEEDADLASAFAGQMALCFRNNRRLEELRSSESNYRRRAEQFETRMNEQVAKLRQAESLAEMGQMVSTVAHEIRNVLHVIQMGAQAMRVEIGDDLKKAEILQEIDYGVSLLNEVGKELLDYSKPLQLEYSICGVKKLVENTLAAANAKLQSVNLVLNLSDEDASVYVDEAKIIRVLLNIISNAIDAMPFGGGLTISSALDYFGNKPALLLVVKDTGCGIDENDLERVQQPFVTTKKHGTGLGISICRKIINAHGGMFRMSSKLNEGTTVEISLPLGEQGRKT
jgi:signal transduction histidine kinase